MMTLRFGILLCALLGGSSERAFISAMTTAMATMMAQMHNRPSHDIDKDFVNMMVPHHAGAIEMAQAELRYGRNEQTRRLAQEIIVTQREEITALRLSVGEPLPAAGPAQTPNGVER